MAKVRSATATSGEACTVTETQNDGLVYDISIEGKWENTWDHSYDRLSSTLVGLKEIGYFKKDIVVRCNCNDSIKCQDIYEAMQEVDRGKYEIQWRSDRINDYFSTDTNGYRFFDILLLSNRLLNTYRDLSEANRKIKIKEK